VTTVEVRLKAATREDLDTAIARLELFGVSSMTMQGEWFADGTLRLYDTPEIVETKVSTMVEATRRLMDG
jgi:hypothetical protein